MRNTKKVLSLVLVVIMLLSSTMTFAANGDVFVRSNGNLYATSTQIALNPSLGNAVVLNPGVYKYENNGFYYSIDDLFHAFTTDNVNFLTLLAPPTYTPLGPVVVTPPVIPTPNTYKIQITADDMTLVGDGLTNTTIHVELVDNITGVRENVNGLQVRLTTTYGQLADQQITLQNGYGHTTLNSEAVQRFIDVDIDAQVIESTVPVAYKNNITGMTAKLGMVFKTPGGAQMIDIPRLLKAESNQADRVTLFFDRNVNPADFNTGNSLATVSQVSVGLRNIVGFHRLPGNDPHTLEVILDKTTVLTDNETVSVSLSLTRNGHTLTVPAVSFILTDNRKPQVTEIVHNGNMRELAVYFSESIVSAQFSLDGGTNPIISSTYHDFDDAGFAGIDRRHIVTLNVQYLAPGEHTLQISAAKDFAYATDTENIGTTQELKFTVIDNTFVPNATVKIESPEQYRIFLSNSDTQYGYFDPALQSIELQMETSPGNWDEVFVRVADINNYPNHSQDRYKGILSDGTHPRDMKLAWVTQHGNELVVETNTDWTYVFDTAGTTDNYFNHHFRLFIPAGTFINGDNNLPNVAITLPLENLVGHEIESLFGYQDYESPVMVGRPALKDAEIGEFDIKYDEPVKAINIEEAEVGETPSQSQFLNSSGLPNVGVRYRGTLNGTTVEIPGSVVSYVSAKGKDTDIKVKADRSLQTLVDEDCYEEDWVLIVENVTDDFGNAAVTITEPFTVTATPAPDREFEIAEAEIVTGGTIFVNLPTNVVAATLDQDYDIVRVEYTDFIRLTGNDDNAINKSNYKLNGRDLGTDSFVLVDLNSHFNGKVNCLCRYPVDGYNAVYIFTPKGSTIDTQGPNSNSLEVNQRLYSKNFAWAPGVKLSPEYQVQLNYTISWNGFGRCVEPQKPNVPGLVLGEGYEEPVDPEPGFTFKLTSVKEPVTPIFAGYTLTETNVPDAAQFSVISPVGGTPTESVKKNIGEEITGATASEITIKIFNAAGDLLHTFLNVSTGL